MGRFSERSLPGVGQGVKRRTNSGSNNVTLGTSSSQLIEGASTKTLGAYGPV